MFELCSLDAEIHRLRTRRFELGASLCDVHFRHNALVVPIVRDFQSLLETSNSSVKQTFLFVQTAQLEIVDCQLGMRAEPNSFQVGRGRLCGCSTRFYRPANFSPHVGFVREVDRQLVEGPSSGEPSRTEKGPIRTSRPGDAAAPRDCRKESCTRDADRGPCGPELCFGCGNILV